MIQFIRKCGGFIISNTKCGVCNVNVDPGDTHIHHYDTNGYSNTEYIVSLFIHFLHPILLYYLEKTIINRKQFGESFLPFILELRFVSWLPTGCNDLNVHKYKLLNNQNSMLLYDHIYCIRNNLHSAFYATVSCSRRHVLLQRINIIKKTQFYFMFYRYLNDVNSP